MPSLQSLAQSGGATGQWDKYPNTPDRPPYGMEIPGVTPAIQYWDAKLSELLKNPELQALFK